jgi:hypothetical protein
VTYQIKLLDLERKYSTRYFLSLLQTFALNTWPIGLILIGVAIYFKKYHRPGRARAAKRR